MAPRSRPLSRSLRRPRAGGPSLRSTRRRTIDLRRTLAVYPQSIDGLLDTPSEGATVFERGSVILPLNCDL